VSRSLVYVEWEDARGVTTDWVDLKELSRHPTSTCTSMGLLLGDHPDRIVICPHWFQGEPHQGCGEMVIPRSQIRKMRRLKMGKKLRADSK
jgi:hypothetical protein